ncbi:MAG: 3-ketoacyl-ACP reductase [Blastopirellula sp. JB062]
MSKSLPVAIVTGSSRGIGRGIATALAADGYAVTINYNSNKDAADQVVEQIRTAGGQAIAVGASVADRQGRDALLKETLDAFGRLDLLVNNAGITSPGRKDLLEATEENWDLVFETNLKGPFFLSQIAALAMIDQIAEQKIAGGKIINISSLSSYAVSSNRADYCMAKAGLQMMTWLLAERLAADGIQVFEICPGVIASDMTAPVKEKYDRLIADGMTPIRRWGEPQDVAKAIIAIARDHFPFSTGERINVDGGFHLRKL